jgi:hypothetical protein
MTMQIFCSKSKSAHDVATITADDNGFLLNYSESVSTTPKDARAVLSPQDGWHYLPAGDKRQLRAPVHEVLRCHRVVTRVGSPNV